MGTFKSFVDSKGLSAKHIATASRRVEQSSNGQRTLLSKRAMKRGDKELAAKTYAELNLAKPAQLGRGVSENQVNALLKDVPLPRKVRSKVLRAVNAVLATKKQAAVDMKALFEGQAARLGKKKEEKKAEPAKKKK